LLRTWIGSIPLSSDFRRELLQKGKIDNELLTRYKALKPAAERVAAVKSWIEPPEPKQEPKPENQSTAPEIPESTIAPAATPKIAATQAQPQSPPSGETSSVEIPSVEKPKSQGKAIPRVEARPVQVTLANAFPKHEITEEANLKREEEMEELTAESLISQQLYHAKLLKWTYQHLRYPPKAHKRRQEGHVRLSVTISRTGKLEAVNVISESGYALLNNEAINAVKESSPYPSMPEDVRGRQFEFSIPIEFRL
ncbi:MAG: TonB family protein, partial [Exilibacterium sp.]